MVVEYKKTGAERDFDFVHNLLNDYWKNIAINIFEWKRKCGLPLSSLSEGLTSTQIEEELYDKGSSLFFKDENIGYMALPVAPANKLNVYRKPTNFRAIGNNYNKEYNLDNSVLIKNNTLKKATFDIVDYYTSKLADIELTKDLHRNAHKMPLVFECTEDTLLTAKNIFKKIHSNEPVIFKNRTRGEGEVGVNVLNANVAYINDKLEDDYHNYEARILTALGLDNYVEDKKERVQSAEVESQQEYIISSFRASLNERKKACEAINKMFGLDLVVDYVKAEQIETDEPVDESEEVVDNE